jgi:hypothetical protein
LGKSLYSFSNRAAFCAGNCGVLLSISFIFSIEIFDDGLFKLNTDLKLTPDYINTKLVEFKAKIEDEYLQ